MKKILSLALLLFIAISFSFSVKENQNLNKLTATYLGITEDDYYKFVDKNKKEFLFYDFDDAIEIDLYEDSYIGKNFELTWLEKEVAITDDDGEETGEKMKIKTIVSLKINK
ncbi:hypothetical protein [Polaribacter tangerinus]|uniref:hypothetical protein n=1 Tax=Polaribacter tangerinus TaxID=1920034 RepID=UPI000B4B9B51|nr:hypothetical protein [Polaribacter tangerinus]